jgi:hypothetical protein
MMNQGMMYAQNLGNKARGTSSMQKIILAVVLILIFYFIYTVFIKSEDNKMLIKLHPALQSKVIQKQSIPAITTSDYTIATWIFINDWSRNYGEEKNVLSRFYTDNNDDNKKKPAPSFVLDGHTNNLHIKMSYFPASGNSSSKSEIHNCTIRGLPLQKWCCVIMTINNRVMDIYLDGKLTKTCVIPGVPQSGLNSDMYISEISEQFAGTKLPGFSGFLSDLRVYKYAINPRQAYNLYKQGNSASGMSALLEKYKLKFALMENNKEVNTILL